jgi:hypothetical protein
MEYIIKFQNIGPGVFNIHTESKQTDFHNNKNDKKNKNKNKKKNKKTNKMMMMMMIITTTTNQRHFCTYLLCLFFTFSEGACAFFAIGL